MYSSVSQQQINVFCSYYYYYYYIIRLSIPLNEFANSSFEDAWKMVILNVYAQILS